MKFVDVKLFNRQIQWSSWHTLFPRRDLTLIYAVSVPAVDHYGGVVVPVASDSFDKLNESAAGLWDSVLRPRCVVEVTDQNVVPVLHRQIHTTERTAS